MSLLFLVGMPAVGKSYWASQIAAHYNYKCVDTDDELELITGMPIPQIFASKGENEFRLMEQALLQRHIMRNTGNTIVACGGGTPCYLNNMSLMKNAGCVVYLDAAIPVLIEHLANDDKQRPLLATADLVQETLSGLYHDRKMVYEQAHYILPAENISLTTFDKIITACISGH